MNTLETKQKSFIDCPFKLNLPKISVTGQWIYIDFQVNFIGKPKPIKYVISECRLIDTANNSVSVQVSNQSNFLTNSYFSISHTLSIESQNITTHYFIVQIIFLTINGERIVTSYRYIQNSPVKLDCISVSTMDENDKTFFKKELEKALVNDAKNVSDNIPHPNPTPMHSSVFNLYIEALSSELFFLKNHGGKKYKATDGRLLTPNSNEF